jgi:sugar phosphate isomerase/epimerase
MQRREFLTTGLAAAATACLSQRSASASADEPAASAPLDQRLCLFTDHLDDAGYSYAEVAASLSQLKIAGPDLTVRPGGLVPPDRVAEELPKAAAALGDQGLSIPMLTTNLTTAADPTARPILSTMGKLGIRYYKLGYYHYDDLARWDSELEARRKDLAGLVELGRQYKVTAGLHNHAGGVGGAIWDAWELLRPLDPAGVGFYFDPAHASIEGAKQAWKLNFHRITARLTMVALKDYVWEKTTKGWQTRWCPLGEGMVNWTEFFAVLAKTQFPGPISIHIEYDPGGSTKIERLDNSFAAAQRDIGFVRKHLAQAGAAK